MPALTNMVNVGIIWNRRWLESIKNPACGRRSDFGYRPVGNRPGGLSPVGFL